MIKVSPRTSRTPFTMRTPLSLLLATLGALASVGAQYQPNWDSLDTRPLPAWYDDSKFGIFVHWGAFSVVGYMDAWFWYDWVTNNDPNAVAFMANNYPPDFTYQDFAPQFQIEFFDPDEWADIFAASGARYVVLTSKHHEGYTMWPSKVAFSWNSMDVGPKMDLVGALSSSIRNRTSLHFGLYHSLYEWYNPVYLQDKSTGFVNSTFPAYKTIPELHEIVEAYKPEVIWSDGDWEAGYSYWTSEEFIAWLYNESPVKETVVVNDRWGQGAMCEHGDFYTCSDNYNPGVLQAHKWENCMTIDKQSWGYRRNAVLADFRSIEEILESLVTTISCGGNLLLNVGPTPDGRIIPVFEERLRQVGRWLGVNGEAVYSSSPWTYQNDTLTPNVWYTTNTGSGAVYAFLLSYPSDYIVKLGAPITGAQTQVSLLGAGPVGWETSGAQGLTVTLPCLLPASLQWAWVLKLENVQ